MQNSNDLDIYENKDLVGTLSLVGDEFSFRYDPEWVKKGKPIIEYIPLDCSAKSRDIFVFFGNYLPSDSQVQEALKKRLESFLERNLSPEELVIEALRYRGQDLPGALHTKEIEKQERERAIRFGLWPFLLP